MPDDHPRSSGKPNLADSVYQQLRSELFDFRLLPGDHFSEVEVAGRTGASRTPVRQALYRLHREGFLDVRPRSGWEVKPLNFEQLDALYELRSLIEQGAVRRLGAVAPERLHNTLGPLEERWIVPTARRTTSLVEFAAWDEDFHGRLVGAANNAEFVRVHWDVTERIRITRRLDFTEPTRIRAAYEEHASILRALRRGAFEDAAEQLRVHIQLAQAAARKVTQLRLKNARQSLGMA